MKNKELLKVYVEPWLKTALEKLAERQGKSLSRLAEEVLERYVRSASE